MYITTALQIIRQTAAELGLPVPNSAVTSQEATTIQLLALLNAAGYELAHAFEWQQLMKKGTVVTVAGQSQYTLPSDFGKMVSQTIWSSDSLQPVTGPLSPQRWEQRTEGIEGTGPFIGFRIWGNQLSLYPAPESAGQEITFEYMSNGWVQGYLDPNAYTPYILNDLDTPQFDFMLMVKFLKLKMWTAKGLDTTALQADFNMFYDMMTSQNKSAPILGLTRRHHSPVPLCVPETGYGK